jgi:hypothetical protein
VVLLRLSPEVNKAFIDLLKTGPFKDSYTSPVQYGSLRVRATLKAVQEELLEDDDEETITLEETLSATSAYPFTYDGMDLVDGGPIPRPGLDVSRFEEKRSSVGVEVSVLGYRIGDNQPGYSVSMRGVYYLGHSSELLPTSPGKRKGNFIVSPRRKRGVFNADLSKGD